MYTHIKPLFIVSFRVRSPGEAEADDAGGYSSDEETVPVSGAAAAPALGPPPTNPWARPGESSEGAEEDEAGGSAKQDEEEGLREGETAVCLDPMKGFGWGRGGRGRHDLEITSVGANTQADKFEVKIGWRIVALRGPLVVGYSTGLRARRVDTAEQFTDEVKRLRGECAKRSAPGVLPLIQV